LCPIGDRSCSMCLIRQFGENLNSARQLALLLGLFDARHLAEENYDHFAAV
jgi:hypothetical protein